MKQIDPAIAGRISAEKAAENIRNKIDELAADAAARYDQINGRPEDWLNDSFRRLQVQHVIREVLIDFLLGKRR
jgi:hypothetical protein